MKYFLGQLLEKKDKLVFILLLTALLSSCSKQEPSETKHGVESTSTVSATMDVQDTTAVPTTEVIATMEEQDTTAVPTTEVPTSMEEQDTTAVQATEDPNETAIISVRYHSRKTKEFTMNVNRDEIIPISLEELTTSADYAHLGAYLLKDVLSTSAYMVDPSDCAFRAQEFSANENAIDVSTLYGSKSDAEEEKNPVVKFVSFDEAGERYTYVYGVFPGGELEETFILVDGEPQQVKDAVSEVNVNILEERTAKNDGYVHYAPSRWQRRNIEHGRDPFYRPNTHKLVRKRFK